jgi:threonine dehydratase
MTLPTYQDVLAAKERLADEARRTPLLESDRVNELLGCRLLIKAENLQRTGSFKFRGAYNRICQLTDAERQRGVVAFSSGNHAQGVALASKLLNVPASIVMPSDAPKIKIENTRGYGAEVVLYDRKNGNRVQVAEDILAKTDGIMVPPYNDPDIICGQGTIGLEICEQAREIDAELDVLTGPSSGGGMMSGCALAFSELSPETQLFAVEPANYDDIARSLKAGERVTIQTGTPSLCDALLLETPGELTFEIMKARLAGGLVVTDDEALAAVKLAFQEFKIVLEPSAATSLAAILTNKVERAGKTVGVICTGGNVDPAVFRRAIN